MKNIIFNGAYNLLPVIIQDVHTKNILMLGYMNQKALHKTTKTGLVYFWSRSRKKLWMKGEESGTKLKVTNIFIDCDGDALLIKVQVVGKSVCHTGKSTCFFNNLTNEYDTR